MNEQTTKPIRRGNRRPTAVHIERRKNKKGTSYRIRWIDLLSGKTMSEPCGRDMAYARIRRDQKKAELRDGLSGKLPDKTLSELKEELAKLMIGKSPNTIRKTKHSLQQLIDLCSDRWVIKVDKSMIMDFRAKRLEMGVAVATLNKDLRQIKSALTYAVDNGWLHMNPLCRWKDLMLREPEKRIRVIEAEEFAALLEACRDPVFQALIIVAYRQGLRRTELVNLRWEAIDFDKEFIHVLNFAEAGELTKSRKNRHLPMAGAVKKELAQLYESVPKIVENGTRRPKYPHVFTWPNGVQFKDTWVTHEFARIVKKTTIPHCTLHDLRRSFSTLAQRAGVDKATVKDLGGWSTIGVVEKHYTGDTSGVLRSAMNKIAQIQGVA